MKFNGKKGSWEQAKRKKVRENKTRNVIMIINVLTFADRITTKSPGGVCDVSYILAMYTISPTSGGGIILQLLVCRQQTMMLVKTTIFCLTCVVVICTRRTFSSLNK